MDFQYNGIVCSDLEIVKSFVDGILKKIKPIINDENIMFDVRLILNELIVNGVMPGNKCISSKCVKLLLEIKDQQIKIQVEDEGQGINYDLVSYDPEKLSFCGRGLVLVDGLSDELYVQENKVTAVKQLS